MRRFGFKLFSSNLQNNPSFVAEATEFVRANRLKMYIELMVLPTTPADDMETYRSLFAGLDVVIHAPHNAMNFDTGYAERFADNVKIVSYAQKAADMFAAPIIVVHAGGGNMPENLEETARQFRLFNDRRIVVENLPYRSSDVKGYMHGTTPEQIKYIMEESGCGFCFDFSHAVCAANSLKLDLAEQLAGFYALRPTIYHLCDGNVTGVEDRHLHYGKGNFPLAEFMKKYIAEDALITMETGNGVPKTARSWIKDFGYLQRLNKK